MKRRTAERMKGGGFLCNGRLRAAAFWTLWALALLAGAAGAGRAQAEAAGAPENLIVNPGFDQGLEGWRLFSVTPPERVAVVEEPGRGHVAKLSGTDGPEVSIWQMILFDRPVTRLAVAYRGKVSGRIPSFGPVGLQLAVRLSNGELERVYPGGRLTNADTEWTAKEGVYEAPEGQTIQWAQVYLLAYRLEGDVLYDDIVLHVLEDDVTASEGAGAAPPDPLAAPASPPGAAWAPVDHLFVSETGWEANPAYVSISTQAERLYDDSVPAGLLLEFTRDPKKAAAEWAGYQIRALKRFAPSDWSDYNRLTFWVYPVGGRTPALSKVGYPWHQAASAQLKPGQWNQVVWDFGHLSEEEKANFTQFYFAMVNIGHFPDEPATQKFYLSNFRLERVPQAKYVGWEPDPARPVLNHLGFLRYSPKTALTAASFAGAPFVVRREEDGAAVFTGTVRREVWETGEYGVIDFTGLDAPGVYRVEAGGTRSYPFRIGEDVYREAIEQGISFFRNSRSGGATALRPAAHTDDGVDAHGVAHDFAGGWYDAGDTLQFIPLSVAITATLGHLLEVRPSEELYEEFIWGLRSLAKWQREDGGVIRGLVTTGAANFQNYLTDGEAGTGDERLFATESARFALIEFDFARAMALGARLLRERDPDFAAACWERALAAWQAATATAAGSAVEFGAWAAAAVEMYRASGEARYRRDAEFSARVLTRLQQTRLIPDSPLPVAGYFKESLARARPVVNPRYLDRPVVGLAAVMEAFPDSPDWFSWYAALTLYGEFYARQVTRFTAPYRLMPHGLWRGFEAAHVARRNPALFVQLGNYFLRLWSGPNENIDDPGRASNRAILTQAVALAAAAAAQGDRELEALAHEQVQWVLGRNPFNLSLMTEVGHEWTDFVVNGFHVAPGAIIMGIGHTTDGEPYFPRNAAGYHYEGGWVDEGAYLQKEVQGAYTGYLLHALRYLNAPALLSGRVIDAGRPYTGLLQIVDAGGRVVEEVAVREGRFGPVALPPADAYTLRAAGARWRLPLAAGARRELVLDASSALAVDVQAPARLTAGKPAAAKVRVVNQGAAPWSGRVAVDALNVHAGPLLVDGLAPGEERALELELTGREAGSPYVLLVYPEGGRAFAARAVGIVE